MPIAQMTKQKGMDGVSTGSRASTRIPTQGAHYSVSLIPRASGGTALTVAQAAASLGQIQIFINGDLKVNCTVAELFNLYYLEHGCFPGADSADTVANQLASACVIRWDWLPAYLDTLGERALYGIGMANVQSYEITVDVVNPAGATACASIDVHTDSDPNNRTFGIGSHRTLLSYPRSTASTGDREEKDIPFGDKTAGALAFIYTWKGTGTLPVISKITERVNNSLVIDQMPPELATVDSTANQLHRPQTVITEVSTAANLHRVVCAVRHDASRSAASFLDFASVMDLRFTETWSAAAPNAFNILVYGVKGIVRK